MGNYRQHVAFGTLFGVVYSVGAALLAGLHWMYAAVAVLLSTLGGMLPDLDSPSGVSLRGFTGILGVLGSLVVWRSISLLKNPPGFEYHLCAMLMTYLFIRHGLRKFMAKVAVHRGMCHSIPTGLLWGSVTYLCYPSDFHAIRMSMAFAVMLGFLSHLILDEICSVDLQGVRVNKAFGTALKFWGDSAFGTIFVYVVLSFFCWRVTKVWPDEEVVPVNLAAPGPNWPYPWPQSWFKDNFKELREFAHEQFQNLPGHVEQVKAVAAKELDGLPEDLTKLKSHVVKQAPLVQEKLEQAKELANRNLPAVQEKVDQAKKFVDRNVTPENQQRAKSLLEKAAPGTVEKLKRVAGEGLPLPKRR